MAQEQAKINHELNLKPTRIDSQLVKFHSNKHTVYLSNVGASKVRLIIVATSQLVHMGDGKSLALPSRGALAGRL
jgi:hypothetical protein